MFIESMGERARMDEHGVQLGVMLRRRWERATDAGGNNQEHPMYSKSQRSIWTFIVVGATFGCSHASGSNPTTQPRPEPAGQQASVVGSETIDKNPGVSVERILADRVPGVHIGRAADGSMTVTIRGATSFALDNQPLYVIDDVPIAPGPGG